MKIIDGHHRLTSFAEIEAFQAFVQRQTGPASLIRTPTSASAFIKLVVGLHSIGQTDLSTINEFLANRYFLDACLVDRMPQDEEITTWARGHDALIKQELRALLPSHPIEASTFDLMQALLKCWQAEAEDKISPKYFGEDARESLQRDGYLVIPDVLSPNLCAALRQAILDNAAEEREQGVAYYYGKNNNFQRIYNIITKGSLFAEALSHPLVRTIMDTMFDRPTLHQKYTLSSFHANIVPRHGEAQKLHVDNNVPAPLPPWIIRANINFILEDYTRDRGATLCVPGSHLWLRKPEPEDRLRVAAQLHPLEAKTGSIVVWHGSLWHQSGNNSSDQERVALLVCFAASFLLEMALEENHFQVMSEEYAKSLPGDLYRILGWSHGVKSGAKATPTKPRMKDFGLIGNGNVS